MPGARCCERRLRNGQGRPSRAVRLAARSGDLQLVDEGEKRVGSRVDGLEEGYGLQVAVSDRGLVQPLPLACLLAAADDLGVLHAGPSEPKVRCHFGRLQLLLDERLEMQDVGTRAVTPGTRHEAPFGETAATGRLGSHSLAHRQRQQSEGEFSRAGGGAHRRQDLGEDAAGFAVEPQHDGIVGRAGPRRIPRRSGQPRSSAQQPG